MNLDSQEEVASLLRFANITKGSEVAEKCRQLVEQYRSEDIREMDRWAILEQALNAIDPDRHSRANALGACSLIATLPPRKARGS